ncbi:hypothetical protein BDW66DRAFT_57945 [Aspergillus desertorum]
MLRVSHTIHLRLQWPCTIFELPQVRMFGAFSEGLLTSFPTPLPSCSAKKHGLMNTRTIAIRSDDTVQIPFLMLLGSSDFKTAMQRCWFS